MNLRRAALTIALLVPSVSHGQHLLSGGPFAPIVLLLPAGARTLALGNTGVAGRDDDVLFFNPAQVAVARGFSASVESYAPGVAGGSMSSVTRFGTGGIALGMRMVDYDLPTSVFPADRGTMLGGDDHGTSIEATLGVAQVVKGLRIGGAVKYVEDDGGTIRVGRGALDLGLSKDLFRFYTVGLSVQNIGASTTIPCSFAPLSLTSCVIPPFPGNASGEVTSANLPLRTTLGVSTSRPLGEFDVVGTAAVSMLRDDFVSPSGGIEVGYSWLDGYSIALRGGARRSLPGERPLTAGVGFTMDRLSIDYALETLTELRFVGGNTAESTSRIAHRIGLRIR